MDERVDIKLDLQIAKQKEIKILETKSLVKEIWGFSYTTKTL